LLALEKMISDKAPGLTVSILDNLINHTRYLVSRVMDLQRQQVWVGWLFPEFVEQIRNQIDYFVACFNDTLSPDAERIFWMQTNAENLACLAHLLNTNFKRSRPIVQLALTLSDEALTKISTLSTYPIDLLQLATLSREFDHVSYATKTVELFSRVWTEGKSAAVASNVCPVLLNRLNLVAKRSLLRLQQLPSVTAVITTAVRAGGNGFRAGNPTRHHCYQNF
jgi:hypothetical protein